MKFRYIGDYPEGAEHLDAYGVRFTPGAVLEVPAQFEQKFIFNRFFVREDEVLVTEPAVEPLDKATLIAEAEARGVKIDKRWSADKIAAKLQEAA